MYFSNLVIDSVVEKIPEIFNFHKSDEKAFAKRTKSDVALGDAPFPVEPALWPDGEANATIDSYRGAGAIAMVHGAMDGLMVKLNTGGKYESFMERRYMQGSIKVSAQTKTVLDGLEARSLWPNVADNVVAPQIGSATGVVAEATLENFVKCGKHVEGVAARLLALALEHALVPFTQRTRVRNAAASYWCTGKYRSDNIAFSLQTTQSILDWASPNAVGKENDPTVVIWVGPADKTRGMSLLSRIMDVTGPMMQQEAFLLTQFDAGKLLMVGTGALRRDFRAVQPDELNDAIDEALWLLMTYNNLDVAFIKNALRLLIRNLPIVDLAHYRESTPLYWRAREGAFGVPNMTAAMAAELDVAIRAAYTDDARDALDLQDMDLCRGLLSDNFRRVILAPGDGVAGLAPSIDVAVDWRVLGLLAAMQTVAVGAIDGTSVHTARFDPQAPPTIPNMAPLRRGDVNGVFAAFSGRAGFHLFAYSNPIDPANPVAPPDGWQIVAAPPAALAIPAGVANDGAWLEWIGGNDAAGVANVVGNGLRAYVVRQWLPTSANNYLNNFVPPPADLRRFDVPDGYQMAVRMNGAFPDLVADAPRVQAYVDENARGGNALDYLVVEGQRNLNALTVGQRSLAFLMGLAYVADAALGAISQNDAYRRWVAANHGARHLTTVPDELMLYLGGMRSRRYVEACGGLWTLCFQKSVETTTTRAGHEEVMSLLRDRSMLASYMLKLRCAVEMSDQMCRVSNARVTGCYDPYLWDNCVDDRLNDAHIDENTLISRATYMSRQACVLAAVFDHPDAAVARSFDVVACSTLRLREPVVGAVLLRPLVQHMNWMTPQCLRYNTWSMYYGVAAPTFVPDRVCRSWLRDARYTTRWIDCAPEFAAGAMFDVEDEVWSAMLTGMVDTDWYPTALELAQFGSRLLVDVSAVRTQHAIGYTQPLMRLNLPYETRLGVATVRGADLDTLATPDLPCDGVPQWPDGHVLSASAVTYDARGKVTAVTLDPAAAGCENIDVRDTTFASRGVHFGRYVGARVVGPFLNCERNVGQFWMCVMHVAQGVSAGMCAGAQRLLEYLLPPEPVVASEDGKGEVVTSAGKLETQLPDVTTTEPPGAGNLGDTGLHEFVAPGDALSIINGMSGIDDATRNLLLEAFSKSKSVSLPGTVATVSTTGTDSVSMLTGDAPKDT